MSEPYLSFALSNGCRISPNARRDREGLFVGAWFSTLAFAQEHPDAIRRFRAVIAETARWANAHHDASAHILERYTKLRLPAGHEGPLPERAERAHPAVIDAAAQFGVEGELPSGRPLAPIANKHPKLPVAPRCPKMRRFAAAYGALVFRFDRRAVVRPPVAAAAAVESNADATPVVRYADMLRSFNPAFRHRNPKIFATTCCCLSSYYHLDARLLVALVAPSNRTGEPAPSRRPARKGSVS